MTRQPTANILVVDDECGMRDMIELQLMESGYSVMKAEGGSEALLLLEENEFDLVVSDMRMPHRVLDGHS